MKGNDYNGDNDPSEQVQEKEKHNGDVDDDVGVVIRMVRGDGHGEENDRVALISYLSYVFLSRLKIMRIFQQKKI